MSPLFLGIDVAGGENTWLASLAKDGNRVFLDQQPRRVSLAEIIQCAEQRDVLAVAIDAQLSIALSDENGFRSSDTELRGGPFQQYARRAKLLKRHLPPMG